MSSVDPAKLKVVELRAELTSRGLDTKGVKAVLVKRLKDALQQEEQEEIADTTIADTSTEDYDTSTGNVVEEVVNVPPDKAEEHAASDNKIERAESADGKTEKPAIAGDQTEKAAIADDQTDKPAIVADKIEKSPIADAKVITKAQEPIDKPSEATSVVVKESKLETEPSGTNIVEESIDKPQSEIPKAATAGEPEAVAPAASEDVTAVLDATTNADEKAMEVSENGNNLQEAKEDISIREELESIEVVHPDEGTKVPEFKGEKRRRASPSPDRVPNKRSKSPIKEEEPLIDNNKVQLSWYDSDLHLQIDKKTFLSGKPYHEGAFGYAWAGARATHGVKAGKVCFEVKITEELKWDDVVKQSDRRRDGHRGENSKRDRQRSDRGKENSKTESTKVIEESTDKNKDVTVPMDTTSPSEEKKDYWNPTDSGVDLKTESSVELKLETDDIKEDKEEEVEKIEKADVHRKEEKMDVKEETENESKQETTTVDEPSSESLLKNFLRVGWSLVDTSLQLGECEFSYGYESTGKFVTNKIFTNYGTKFGLGDVIGAYLNISEDCVMLNFTVNGELQPEVTSIAKSEFLVENLVLFPHVLARNFAFDVNFGSLENPWFPTPENFKDYIYIGNLEGKVDGPRRLQYRSDCEVIMMCGLPASGKTHWVHNMLSENHDKKYTIIGNSSLLEKMTVNGNPLKNNYKGRWNVILDRLMKCINILVETAALRRRNFIIDQTNVFPSAQRRKMRLFEGFKRRAMVVVVGDDEQAKRRAQQEAQDGKDVPDSAILEMKANMSLPKRGDWLEEVNYVELNEEDAKVIVQKYNQQGREAGFGPIGGQRSGYRDNRGHPYRWDHSTSRRDYRGGYRDHRHQSHRYERSRQHGGWHNRRPPPGSWNRDVRRDGRGSSRDYRNNNRSSDGGSRSDRSLNRDSRNRSQSSHHYSRNSRSQSNRNQTTNWQGSANPSWQNPGNWAGQGIWSQNNWNQGVWNGGGGGGGGSGQPSQWKNSYGQGGYSQGGGYGNYSNWNYYSYPQNWNSQNNVG